MPGRPPKPNNLKVLQGSKRKRQPERKPTDPNSFPRKPNCLNKFAQAEFKRIREALEAEGRFRLEDRALLVAYCNAYALMQQSIVRMGEFEKLYRFNDDDAMPVFSPDLSIFNKQLKNLESLANQLGFSPAARMKLDIQQTEKKESFADSFKKAIQEA